MERATRIGRGVVLRHGHDRDPRHHGVVSCLVAEAQRASEQGEDFRVEIALLARRSEQQLELLE